MTIEFLTNFSADMKQYRFGGKAGSVKLASRTLMQIFKKRAGVEYVSES